MIIMMTEEYWRNSQLSVVRFYGRCSFNGHEYWIVDKNGLDLFALSAIKKNGKAIEAGEPADLVRFDFLPFYRKLKRKRFMEILKSNPNAGEKELKTIYKEACKENKKTKREEQTLFDYEHHRENQT